MFERQADFVISIFHDYQIEDNCTNKNLLDDILETTAGNSLNSETPITQNCQNSTSNDANFPKYLTSEQLTHLQVKDVNFRRQYLIQFLIVLQYISNPPVKGPKLDGQTTLKCTTRQRNWISRANRRLDEILSKMTRKSFNRSVIHQETSWNIWKDKSCPSLNKAQQNSSSTTFLKAYEADQTSRKRAYYRAQDLAEKVKKMRQQEGVVKSETMSENINISSKYMEFIKNEKYDDVPTPVKFFESGFEVGNPIWRYKALRLLSEKSRLFWSSAPAKHNHKPLKNYLESMRERIKKEVAEWDAEEEKRAKLNTSQDGINEDSSDEEEEVTNQEIGPKLENGTMLEKDIKRENSMEEGELISAQNSVAADPGELQVSDSDIRKLRA